MTKLKSHLYHEKTENRELTLNVLKVHPNLSNVSRTILKYDNQHKKITSSKWIKKLFFLFIYFIICEN